MKIREKKCRRRLESPRGTVMLEFALIMPVLLMIGMFVIEILQYHDAQLMADHAAWRLARIAAVRTSGKDGKVTFPKWKSWSILRFFRTFLSASKRRIFQVSKGRQFHLLEKFSTRLLELAQPQS